LILTLSGQNVSLKPLTLGGKAKSYKAKFTYPTDLPDGTYFLLAEVNPTQAVAELDPNNNTAPSAATVAIAAPFVDLSGPVPAGGGTLAGGATVTFRVSVTNGGNVSLKSTLGLSLYLSADALLDADDTALPLATVSVSLKAGGSKAVKAKVAVPAATPGDYFLLVRIDPANEVGELDESNNLLASALPTIVA
jgi:subtilase family serine protease